ALVLRASPEVFDWLRLRSTLLVAGSYRQVLRKTVASLLGPGRTEQVDTVIKTIVRADMKLAEYLNHTHLKRIMKSESDEGLGPISKLPQSFPGTDSFRDVLSRVTGSNATIRVVQLPAQNLEALTRLVWERPWDASISASWSLLRTLGPATSHRLTQLLPSESNPNDYRRLWCQTAVEDTLPFASALAYSQQPNSATLSTGAAAASVVRDIQTKVAHLLRESTESSPMAAKVQSLRKVLVFPLDKKATNFLYKEVEDINKESSYLAALLASRSAVFHRRLSLLGSRVSEKQMLMFVSPLDVRVRYVKANHSVLLPMAAIQPPVFKDGFPDSINYGAFGLLVSKVLVTDVVARNLTDARPCIQRAVGLSTAFSAASILQSGQAELPALRAFQATRVNRTREQDRLHGFQDFTHEQAFYIAGCFLDCRSGLSCLPVLKHSLWFAGAFACPRGSPMNPDEKCRFW
ncbi:unnamed protein product, partial [Ixodes hexagonus]